MKLHEFRCHFREVGRATVPAKPVGTVADPTLVHKQSFFFDQTGRFSGRGGARVKLHKVKKRTAEPKNIECRMSKDGIASGFAFGYDPTGRFIFF